MTTARFIVGDSLTVLSGLPDASVDLVVTSPPFLALRSYLPTDHPDKALEMGSEPTPGEFLDSLLDVVVECRRVLAPHGSLCVELGDTYSGSGGSGGDYTDTALRDGQEKFAGSALQHRRTAQRNRTLRPNQSMRLNADGTVKTDMAKRVAEGKNTQQVVPFAGGVGWPLEKSVCLIPELFRFALVYGFNPLTGRSLSPWRVRNVVRWCRPNPPVGALGDKFRPATSDIAVACTSGKRFFDLDAVRGPASPNTHARLAKDVDVRPNAGKSAERDGNWSTLNTAHDVGGAPPLDWWKVNTRGYPGSHYATYPPELIDRLIKSMCPPKVCTTCGEPSRRIVDAASFYNGEPRSDANLTGRSARGRTQGLDNGSQVGGGGTFSRSAETVGWTDCGHATWRKGVVLDPFAGSGTTLAVATGHGHDAIGIDLDERNADLAADRVGFFLTVERAQPDTSSSARPDNAQPSAALPASYSSR